MPSRAGNSYLAALSTAKIALGWEVRPRSEQNSRGLVVSEQPTSGCSQLERGLVVQGICCSVTYDNAATGTSLMGTLTKPLDNPDSRWDVCRAAREETAAIHSARTIPMSRRVAKYRWLTRTNADSRCRVRR